MKFHNSRIRKYRNRIFLLFSSFLLLPQLSVSQQKFIIPTSKTISSPMVRTTNRSTILLEISTEPLPTRPNIPVVFGGPKRPVLKIRVVTGNDTGYTFKLVNEKGEVVFETLLTTFFFEHVELDAQHLEWNRAWEGDNPDPEKEGVVILNGKYTAEVYVTKKPAKKSNTVNFTRDSRDIADLNVVLDDLFLAPGGDKKKEQLTAVITLVDTVNISKSALQIIRVDQSTTKVVLTKQENKRFTTFNWNGLDSLGQNAPDGQYIIRVITFYKDDDKVEGESLPFDLSRHRPSASISVKYLVFNPEIKDSETIVISQTTSTELDWTGTLTTIIDSKPKTVRTWRWTGQAPELAFDGKNEKGKLLPAGDYDYSLSTQTVVGNVAEAKISGIRLNRVTTDPLSAEKPTVSASSTTSVR
jgi:flagellar hook assembly protein FlgD